MNQNEIFSDNLRRMRKERKLRQADLAKRLEIKRERYAAWEESRGFPPIELLTKVCEILEIDDLYLFLCKKNYESV